MLPSISTLETRILPPGALNCCHEKWPRNQEEARVHLSLTPLGSGRRSTAGARTQPSSPSGRPREAAEPAPCAPRHPAPRPLQGRRWARCSKGVAKRTASCPRASQRPRRTGWFRVAWTQINGSHSWGIRPRLLSRLLQVLGLAGGAADGTRMKRTSSARPRNLFLIPECDLICKQIIDITS